MIQPVLNRVEIVEEYGCLIVQAVWDNVDRPITSGTAFPINKMKLAQRLKVAIKSGKVWDKKPEILTDRFGETYVSDGIKILARTANADLKRLGF